MNEQLLRSGAPIEELNRIRRRISRLKGGKLAALLRPHPIEVLILSDIVNGDPRDVASGPVFADPFAGQSLMPLIRKYQLKLDPALLPYLSSTEASDCGPVPVSYTHLDVYKRQVKGGKCRGMLPAGLCGDRQSGMIRSFPLIQKTTHCVKKENL